MDLNDKDDLLPYIRNTKDGFDPPNVVDLLKNRQIGLKETKSRLQQFAEYKVSVSKFIIKPCEIPTHARPVYLMVFSSDCTKVASTHGDHNIYVSDLRTGKHIQKLEGHIETPWCIAFHPTSNEILASGCLAGEVRVWDLHGGSKRWRADNSLPIASLTFHPTLKFLLIAVANTLHIWDWSNPYPDHFYSTDSEFERVRYVKFDPFGLRVITGISRCSTSWELQSISDDASTNPPSPASVRSDQSSSSADEDDNSRSGNEEEIHFSSNSSALINMLNTPRLVSNERFVNEKLNVINQLHRIQVWDFKPSGFQRVYYESVNVVVRSCKIYNDASLDISQDGEKLAALIIMNELNPYMYHMFVVYSIRPGHLGQILSSYPCTSEPVSVSFSPLAEYIVVGWSYRRPVVFNPQKGVVAQIIKIKKERNSYSTLSKMPYSLSNMSYNPVYNMPYSIFSNMSRNACNIRDITHAIANDNTYGLKCLKWLPMSGLGIACATINGALYICNPIAGEFIEDNPIEAAPAAEND